MICYFPLSDSSFRRKDHSWTSLIPLYSWVLKKSVCFQPHLPCTVFQGLHLTNGWKSLCWYPLPIWLPSATIALDLYLFEQLHVADHFYKLGGVAIDYACWCRHSYLFIFQIIKYNKFPGSAHLMYIIKPKNRFSHGQLRFPRWTHLSQIRKDCPLLDYCALYNLRHFMTHLLCYTARSNRKYCYTFEVLSVDQSLLDFHNLHDDQQNYFHHIIDFVKDNHNRNIHWPRIGFGRISILSNP